MEIYRQSGIIIAMTRLSSSLIWLRTQFAHLKGRAVRAEKLIKHHKGKACSHEFWLNYHNAIVTTNSNQLRAINRKTASYLKAIDLHEQMTDVDEIEPIKPQNVERFTNHGGISRLVFSQLRNSPTRSRYTSEIFEALIKAHGKELSSPQEQKDIRHRLLIRLHNLAYEKRIVKGCEPDFVLDRQWFLP